jgi:regulator of protease activity HflC (stomatin/prohibitin superfamily)
MMRDFGPEWWKNNLERPYFSSVREEIKHRSMKDMMSSTVAGKEVDDALTKALEAKVAELKLPVRIVEINLGRAKPNAKILEQMNDTAAEQQRLLTLEQSRLAEVKRAEQQNAKAIADNAYRNKIGLNVSEFVQLQLADKQIDACRAAKECVLLPPGTATVVGR